MLKKLFIVFLLLSVLFFSISFLKLEKETIVPIISLNIIKKENNEKIGELIIKKINLYQNLYQTTSKKNNVEENVTILEPSIFPDQEKSIVILAAHSGNANNSFFQNLNQLEINDKIILLYKHKKHYYLVKNIWEEKKDGYININKEKENQLVLTTCSPKRDGYQLVINCIEKESI